jgi:hypothetical protein
MADGTLQTLVIRGSMLVLVAGTTLACDLDDFERGTGGSVADDSDDDVSETGGTPDSDAEGESGEGGGEGGDSGQSDSGQSDSGQSDSGQSDSGQAEESLAQIDVLIVIDDSPSMIEEQLAVVTVIPELVDAALTHFPSADIRIGVITSSDASMHGHACGLVLAGDGTLSTAGLTTLQLDVWLACALAVGTLGDDDEQQAGVIFAALDGEADIDAFLRPDAALMLVLASDEDDEHSPGSGSEWAVELAARLALPDDAMVFGLLGDGSSSCAAPSLPSLGGLLDIGSHAADAVELRAMIEATSHHAIGSICASDHSAFVAAAVAVMADVAD